MEAEQSKQMAGNPPLPVLKKNHRCYDVLCSAIITRKDGKCGSCGKTTLLGGMTQEEAAEALAKGQIVDGPARPLEFDPQPSYDFSGHRRHRDSEEAIDHPGYYGGDTPTEPIKVIRAWALGFNLGNAVKYIARAGKKGSALEDLKKARWYLDDEIKAIEGVPEQPATFLSLTGIAEIQRQENQRMNAKTEMIAKGPAIP